MSADRLSHLLHQYHLTPDDQLGQGLEATAYAYGQHQVLKIYPGTVPLAHLETLQTFYHTLSAIQGDLPYALPLIEQVQAVGDDWVITIEKRLHGSALADRLPDLSTAQIDTVMQTYLDAILALGRLRMPPQVDRLKLFDPTDLSRRDQGDWHQFMGRYLDYKLQEVMPYLLVDVIDLPAKIDRLRYILAQPYTGDYDLIHGDIFPGNLLINAQHHITALLDFGLWTMYGDPLFDVATAWVFFDMYDQLKIRARDRLLSLILATMGEAVRGRLYRYMLIYSIIAANAYSSTCADGQYQWCVANLNHQPYWDGIA